MGRFTSFLTQVFAQSVGSWAFIEAPEQDGKIWSPLSVEISNKYPAYEFDKTFDVYSFDRALREAQLRRKLVWSFRLFLIVSIVLGICFLVLGSLRQFSIAPSWAILTFSLSLLAASYLAHSNFKRCSMDSLTLVLSAKKEVSAKNVIGYVDKLILDGTKFAIKDRRGKFMVLPTLSLRAENYLLLLLGEEKHRAASPLDGPYPKGEFYVAIDKSTENTRPKGEVMKFLTDRKRLQETVTFIKSFSGNNPASPNRKLSGIRAGWLKAMEIMLDNFAVWKAIASRENSTGKSQARRRELETLLKAALVTGKKDTNSEELYRVFIDGKNRNFRNWLLQVEEAMQIESADGVKN